MLTPENLTDFNSSGFLVIRGLFSDEEINLVERDLQKRIDELAAYLKVKFSDQTISLDSKMMELERNHPGASLIFIHSNIIGSNIFNFWSSKKILDIVELILGKDIDGHPFFAVRPKPPELDLFVVPWHQDSSYLADGARMVPQVTCWVPLMDANLNNGCMEIAVGEHLNGEKRHVAEEYMELENVSWYLEIEKSVASKFKTEICEVKRGDVIMFTHLTPHRSLPNLSKNCRWSIDMRYMQAGHSPGTSQPSIAFRRADTGLKEYVENSKNNFQRIQDEKDRNLWRHRINRSVWKDRWKEV
ncbi:phytanoyl-CoA dioxygenase family protein [Lentilitoribacter sp. Alg239-R112]|uniref:phytanoyl-CoA dioxygenase family protein n=1 Tax=Lentilitoribacter sp. Alg239-R112 TaxID=2305987 RepID=UPI0013A6D3A0|nr:phytanoyl-CoA dioxygenase family protein [Lentilitoribacter sp. Alg239-R112]